MARDGTGGAPWTCGITWAWVTPHEGRPRPSRSIHGLSDVVTESPDLVVDVVEGDAAHLTTAVHSLGDAGHVAERLVAALHADGDVSLSKQRREGRDDVGFHEVAVHVPVARREPALVAGAEEADAGGVVVVRDRLDAPAVAEVREQCLISTAT